MDLETVHQQLNRYRQRFTMVLSMVAILIFPVLIPIPDRGNGCCACVGADDERRRGGTARPVGPQRSCPRAGPRPLPAHARGPHANTSGKFGIVADSSG